MHILTRLNLIYYLNNYFSSIVLLTIVSLFVIFGKIKNGLTPLHLCAQEDRVKVAQILGKNNATIDAVTKVS